MTITEFENINRDLASFADDEDDLVFYETGEFQLQRFQKTIEGRIYIDDDERKMVEFDGQILPYKKFLSDILARLDLLAEKIIQHYHENTKYIDPEVTLYDDLEISRNKKTGFAIDILRDEIKQQSFLGTKLCFIIAEAGHGKSMLLKQFQYKQAELYKNNKSNYVFLHIDLHGRTLVQLNEAVLSELGDLRMFGIYYSTVLTLLRNRLLVLAIDGFDELVAEQGGEKSLNSLNSLVKNMEGAGTLIAASRRTFFKTQDYVRRAGILRSNINSNCIPNEIKIHNWRKQQCVKYLDIDAFEEGEYSKLLQILKVEDHPLLERPYLFTKMVDMSLEDDVLPSEFITKGDAELENINDVIEQFISREVSKWTYKNCDNVSGMPFLTFDQHIKFLAEVASYMWTNENDTISVADMEALITMLCDEWCIDDQEIRRRIFSMIRSHAMLVNDGDIYRRFDHEEFKNFFLAKNFISIINDYIEKESIARRDDLYRLLYVAQLPDSVGHYLLTEFADKNKYQIFNLFINICKKDWKPTYLQSNVGTLLPFLLNGYVSDQQLIISQSISFSSLVFEQKVLSNIKFDECHFVNISFRNSQFRNIIFDNCDLNDITIFSNSDNVFDNVRVAKNCVINSLTIRDNDDNEEPYTEYCPDIIIKMMNKLGFLWEIDSEKQIDGDNLIDYECQTEYYKTVKKLLYKFNRNSCLYISNILETNQLNLPNPDILKDEIIPLLKKYDIVEERENNKTRQARTKALTLKKYEIPDLFKAEGNPNMYLFAFWQEVKSHK